MSVPAGRVRRATTPELSPADVAAIRALLWAAFPVGEAITEDDWLHALEWRPFVLDLDEEIVAHASVMERDLHVADVSVRTGTSRPSPSSRHASGSDSARRSCVRSTSTSAVATSWVPSAPVATGSTSDSAARTAGADHRSSAPRTAPSGARRTHGYILVRDDADVAAARLRRGRSAAEWRPGDSW